MPVATRHRWFQFSLRSLFIAMALTAILVVGMMQWWEWSVARSVSPAVLRVRPEDGLLHMGVADILADAEYREFKQSHVAAIRSAANLQAAARLSQVRQLPIGKYYGNNLAQWMEKYLIVDATESTLIKLSFADGSALDRVTIINAVKEAYLQELLDADRRERFRKRDELERTHHMLLEELWLKTLLAESAGTISLVSNSVDSIRDLESLSHAVHDARRQIPGWGSDFIAPRVRSVKDAAIR